MPKPNKQQYPHVTDGGDVDPRTSSEWQKIRVHSAVRDVGGEQKVLNFVLFMR